MLQTTPGIVLKTIKYSESSVIVKMYTRLAGLQAYLIRGARGKKSKNRINILQPLSLVEVTALHKEENNKLRQPREVRSAYTYRTIPVDIYKSTIVLFLNEVLYNAIKEEEANPSLFQFLWESLVELDNLEKGYKQFHFSFLLKLTRFLGFAPAGKYSKNSVFFDLEEGCFTNIEPPHRHHLKDPFSILFGIYYNAPVTELHSIQVTVAQKRELMEAIIMYYRLHLPGMGEIKSHRVLQEVMS